MEKIEGLIEEFEQTTSLLNTLQDSFLKKGIIANDLISKNNNIKTTNVRLNHEGQLVIVDYGNFKKTSDKKVPS